MAPPTTRQVQFEIAEDVFAPQGTCIAPSVCECLCLEQGKPWSDPLKRSIPPSSVYGTGDCKRGWEGQRNAVGQFISCHLRA